MTLGAIASIILETVINGANRCAIVWSKYSKRLETSGFAMMVSLHEEQQVARIVAIPELRGLHHRYERQAAWTGMIFWRTTA